jgi:hypothetical protein
MTIITAVLCATGLVAIPATSQASWGGGRCLRANPYHCYTLAGRKVPRGRLGTIAYDNIKQANVPGWAEGDFVTLESWINFEGPEYPRGNYWIETGTVVGAWGNSCCGVHRFNARREPSCCGVNSFQIWVEPQEFLTPPRAYYATYGLMDVTELGGWDVFYEGLGRACGEEWCWVNTFGSWPAKFTEQQAGMEVAAEAMPSVETAQSLGSAWAAGGLVQWPEKQGPFEAWCEEDPSLTVEVGPSMRAWANPDVGTYKYCGGAYGIGDIDILVWPDITGTPGAAPLTAGSADAVLGKPHDTITHKEGGGLESLESKGHEFHPNVPTPKGDAAPTGHNEVIKRGPNGFIESMWVGDGHPHGQALQEIKEPKPQLPQATGESTVPPACLSC